MFGMYLRVITKNGEDEVPVTPRVSVEFERQFQTGLGRALQNDQKLEHMYWIAWKASGGKGTFDKFLDDLIDVRVVMGDERPLSDSQ
ncbi:MAG TPA: hypothetical protein VIG24_03420 [Acidimicrobiia bacterium]